MTVAVATVKQPEKPKYPENLADDHGMLRIDLSSQLRATLVARSTARGFAL